MKTPIISYNLKDRGRQFNGVERNFNIPALVQNINSPATQERVKNRDMHGYYGHWTRIKCGMNPNEGLLEGMKPRVIPAFVTTHLKAFDDGTIEHQAEFAKTDTGMAAHKLFQSRIGGFSSAIDESKQRFFGFDYVLEPNYSSNRGYTLDDLRGISLDDIDNHIQEEQMRGMSLLLDSICQDLNRANQVIEHLSAENEKLLQQMSHAKNQSGKPLRPFAMSLDAVNRLERDRQLFKHTAVLPRQLSPEHQACEPDFALYKRMLERFDY